MRASILCTAAGLILLGLTAGCSDHDHTVVRHETETVRTQPQVYVPVPSTTEHTVIRRDRVEED